MSRAAYMRDYRAKRKAANIQAERPGDTSPSIEEVRALARELVAAQTEIAYLKRELAARPALTKVTIDPNIVRATIRDFVRDPMREFHPAPKSGKKGG